MAGESVTANYGWTLPTVLASPDAWGGYLNTDLVSIDSVVHGIQTSVPAASTATPAMDGVAAVGTSATFARADHVHPTDASRYAASNPAGYQTAAQVTAVLPVASTTTPLVDGVAAIGTSGAFARADHIHPLPPQAIGDNRIINGDMRIDQRWNGASGTASGYTVDRWVYYGAQTGKFNWQRNAGSAVTPAGFPYYLGFVSSTAYAVTSSDYFFIDQPIEADMVSDFAWGTANAQPVTLSFWVWSSLTGTFSGCIANYANTRAYPFTYSIPAVNTWTKIILTIPGDTAGIWVMSGNGGALGLMFDLGSGASRRGTAGAWATVASAINGATGSVSVVGTLNATFFVTGVKLEIGSVATPYNRQSLAKSMADCQRYYEVCAVVWMSDATTANNYSTTVPFAVEKRASPTITSLSQTGAGNGGFNARSGSPSSVQPTRAAQWVGQCASTGPARGFNDSFSASAEL